MQIHAETVAAEKRVYAMELDKQLRRHGLKRLPPSGERALLSGRGWERTHHLTPNPKIEAKAEAKRARRRARNLKEQSL